MRKYFGLLSFCLAAFAVTACGSTAPITLEERLQRPSATRNDFPDWEEFMRYRVSFQYANAARLKLANSDLTIPQDTSMDFQVPFALWDLSTGNNLGAGIAFMDWFNSGLSKNATYGYYFNRGLGFMVNPNTHYFSFDTRQGSPSAADVRRSWDEAYALFTAIHNASGQCYMHGFDQKNQYRKTSPKDVPSQYKVASYWCPHATMADREYRVEVSAWANPYDGIRVLAAVLPQCFRLASGEEWVDARHCGIDLADRQRSLIPDSRFGWMQVIVTPQADDPTLFEVIARTDETSVKLPAPELTEEYRQFLRQQPYSPL